MKIHELYYFNDAGERGYVGTENDPFESAGYKSLLAYSLFNSNRGVGWSIYLDGRCHSVKIYFDSGCRVVIDPASDLIISLGEKDDLIKWPTDAAVFNADGSLNHVIDPPQYICHAFREKNEKFIVEGFYSLKIDNGEVLISLRFEHDWFQTRLYDVVARKWGEVKGAGRE